MAVKQYAKQKILIACGVTVILTLLILFALSGGNLTLVRSVFVQDLSNDVILPTNPVLLIGLSMANVSYWKWLKWTWKIQLLLFAISVLVLLFGVLIGY